MARCGWGAQVLLEQGEGEGVGDAERPDTSSSSWDAVIHLLSRKHDRLDPATSLDLLPDGVRGPTPLRHKLTTERKKERKERKREGGHGVTGDGGGTKEQGE